MSTHAIEIERKFRLRAAPPEEVLAAHADDPWRIEQVYLVQRSGVRRLRRIEWHDGSVEHRLTEKHRIGPFSFREDERVIDGEAYQRLLVEADPDRLPIRKTRHRVPHVDQLLEIDVFEAPRGLVLLEVELGSEAEPVSLPDWVGEWREVTGDPAYFNADLARRGTVVPPW